MPFNRRDLLSSDVKLAFVLFMISASTLGIAAINLHDLWIPPLRKTIFLLTERARATMSFGSFFAFSPSVDRGDVAKETDAASN